MTKGLRSLAQFRSQLPKTIFERGVDTATITAYVVIDLHSCKGQGIVRAPCPLNHYRKQQVHLWVPILRVSGIHSPLDCEFRP